MNLANHWIIVPFVLPAFVAAVLVLVGRRDQWLARVLSLGSGLFLLGVSLALLVLASDGVPRTYALGNWPAPFGIVLVLDQLSALMLVLTALLAVLVLLFALEGTDTRGAHFHALFQFQWMGINGAFLTGDFFNLFVCFEVLLIASYGLMVHGGGRARIQAGLQYVVINIIGSTLFLIAVGMIYAVTGTLNMADLAVQVRDVAPGDRALLHTGALLLLLVFAIKGALVPVHFWLPGTYAHTSAPVAAFFAIMTKVGAYCIIRLYILAFGADAGVSAWLAAPWLLPFALLTLILGMGGVLAAGNLRQQAGFAVIGSVGTLLVAVSLFQPQALAAGLYYLIHSTLAGASLFLVADLVRQARPGYGDTLVAAPRFKNLSLLGGGFFIAAIAMAGMPPLSGFIGKLLILDAARASLTDTGGWAWIWGVILGTSLLAILGFVHAGSMLFWKNTAVPGALPSGPSRGVLAYLAPALLLTGLVVLTVLAGPVTRYLDGTAAQVFDTERYIRAVLGPESALEAEDEAEAVAGENPDRMKEE